MSWTPPAGSFRGGRAGRGGGGPDHDDDDGDDGGGGGDVDMVMMMMVLAVLDLGAVALVRGCLRRKVGEPLEVGPACTVGLVGSNLQSSLLWTTCQA